MDPNASASSFTHRIQNSIRKSLIAALQERVFTDLFPHRSFFSKHFSKHSLLFKRLRVAPITSFNAMSGPPGSSKCCSHHLGSGPKFIPPLQRVNVTFGERSCSYSNSIMARMVLRCGVTLDSNYLYDAPPLFNSLSHALSQGFGR